MNMKISLKCKFDLPFQTFRIFQVLLLLVPLLLFSCSSSELSRSQAQKQIIDTQDFKNLTSVDLISVELRRDMMRGEIPAESVDEPVQAVIERRKAQYYNSYPIVAIAAHFGLIDARITRRDERVDIWSGRPLGFWQTDENYTVSEKGKMLWAEYRESPQETILPTAKKEFVEVIGITKPTETDAMVEFTYRWLPNRFGKSLDPSLAEFKNLPEDLQKSLQEVKSPYGSTYEASWRDARKGVALFKKYDDGWRIVRVTFS